MPSCTSAYAFYAWAMHSLGQHLGAFQPPLNLLIVGIHFLPLAFVFKVPAYLIMGILWLIAIASSMLIVPSTTIIGHTSAWYTIPSICCIIITWLTVLFLLTRESKRLRLATHLV